MIKKNFNDIEIIDKDKISDEIDVITTLPVWALIKMIK